MSSHRTLANSFVRRSLLLSVALIATALVGFRTIHQTAYANGNGETRLLRTPTVSATQIGFAYAQNIWTVPRAGGMARRITSFQGQTSNPHFSPDGKLIVAPTLDSTAKIWNVFTGQLVTELIGHTGAVYSAVFSPDGKLIATTSKDSTAKLWDAISGGLVNNLRGHTKAVFSAVFSPDAKI